MRPLISVVALTLLGSGGLLAQEAEPLSPDEIAEVRRQIAAQQAAEVDDPSDIETLRQRELDAAAARAAPGYGNAARFSMQTRRVNVISDGRAEPHRTLDLDLAEGIITSVAFYDFQGQPWPVQSVAFDRQRLSVNNDGCEGGTGEALDGLGNIIVVTPCDFWTATNMQVVLLGETRPIPFAVTSGTREENIPVDGLLTVAVQSEAPRPFGRDRLGNLDTSWVQPTSRTMTIDPIDYATGNTYPVYVAPGVTTDVAFMDPARNPWPIEEVAFAPGIVAVNGPCDEESGGVRTLDLGEATTMYLTPCQNTTATVAVKMQGRAGAMSLVVTPARFGVVQPDGTLSIVVPGVSPFVPAPTVASAAAPGQPSYRSDSGFTPDRFLDDFLFGTPPQGSTRAVVSGATGVEGWVFDGALYLRGPLNIVNPAFDASAQSSQGTLRVFKYGPPVSRILATDLSGREFVLNVTY